MSIAIQSINQAGATIAIQLVTLVIIAIGSSIMKTGLPGVSVYDNAYPRLVYQKVDALIVWFALSSFVIIVMSEQFLPVWKPIMGDLPMRPILKEFSFPILFVLDLGFVGVLILVTGGAKSSPFTSILGMLPGLAIFLRQPPELFLTYAVLAGSLFYGLSSNKLVGFEQEKNPKYTLSFRTVNILCLVLSTAIGYATRPIPV
ncbi:hypothetical protein [Collimonas humicola]|uniref:hypothetical protein n=1 Tax=Collimonas humicola TaxID=2825886 RepID=UPI001B8B6514|nr:hypothetical protein [Collimonas humicola]